MAETQKKDAAKDTSKDEAPKEFKKPEGDSDAAQSPQETDTPRDPSQAIPDVALPRYLSSDGAAEHSNPQL